MSEASMSNEFPKMLYGPGGAIKVVGSELEETSLGPLWNSVPSKEHRKPPSFAASPGAPVGEQPTQHVSQPTLVLDEALLDRIADRVIERLKARQPSDRKAA